jgi:NADH:ubiquinone oxidoreductase subunit 2 (subunit N)
MLLMFWVSSLSGLFGISLEASVLGLVFSLQVGFLSLSAAGLTFGSGLGLFFVAVMLKAAILPFQGWLITFYRSLSPTALYFYLLTYYIYFILVVYHLLFVLLSPLGHTWALTLMLLLPANLAIGLLTLGEATRLKNLLAVSSAINLFILLALASTAS